jgi:hypothetical protein
MSRTDKTNPYWVQVRHMPPGLLRAKHWHWGGSECDLSLPLAAAIQRRSPHWWHQCELLPEYWREQKMFDRPGYRRSFKSFQDGRARADLRRLKARWLKETDHEEIDSTENLPTSRWRWRRWYWD